MTRFSVEIHSRVLRNVVLEFEEPQDGMRMERKDRHPRGWPSSAELHQVTQLAADCGPHPLGEFSQQ